ncbi:unnamed protein product [Brassica rapa subsp. narinosa]
MSKTTNSMLLFSAMDDHKLGLVRNCLLGSSQENQEWSAKKMFLRKQRRQGLHVIDFSNPLPLAPTRTPNGQLTIERYLPGGVDERANSTTASLFSLLLQSKMDTPLAMGALVSPRLLKFLLSKKGTQ